MTHELTADYELVLNGVGEIKVISGVVRIRRGDSIQPERGEPPFVILKENETLQIIDGDPTWASINYYEIPSVIEVTPND